MLRGIGVLPAGGGVAALWWVFACSLVLGPLGWLSARGVST